MVASHSTGILVVAIVLGIVLFAAILVAQIFYLLLLQRTMNLVGAPRRPVAGGSVWVSFIPVLGLIWFFVFEWLLVVALRRESRATARPRLNGGMAWVIGMTVAMIVRVMAWIWVILATPPDSGVSDPSGVQDATPVDLSLLSSVPLAETVALIAALVLLICWIGHWASIAAQRRVLLQTPPSFAGVGVAEPHWNGPNGPAGLGAPMAPLSPEDDWARRTAQAHASGASFGPPFGTPATQAQGEARANAFEPQPLVPSPPIPLDSTASPMESGAPTSERAGSTSTLASTAVEPSNRLTPEERERLMLERRARGEPPLPDDR